MCRMSHESCDCANLNRAPNSRPIPPTICFWLICLLAIVDAEHNTAERQLLCNTTIGIISELSLASYFAPYASQASGSFCSYERCPSILITLALEAGAMGMTLALCPLGAKIEIWWSVRTAEQSVCSLDMFKLDDRNMIIIVHDRCHSAKAHYIHF